MSPTNIPSSLSDVQKTSAILPAQIPQKNSHNAWPVLTVASGILAGSIYNAFNNQSLDVKIGPSCDMMRRFLPLQLINQWKQTEIKGFALASPLVIALGYEGYRYVTNKSSSDKSAGQSIPAGNHPLADVVKSVALTGMMIGMNQAALTYGGEYLPEEFKISGHIMLKGATTYATVKLLNHIEATGSPKLAKLCGGVIAVTDALFLGNTAACYHTVKEVVAGGVIVGTAAAAIDKTAEPFYSAVKSGFRKAENWVRALA